MRTIVCALRVSDMERSLGFYRALGYEEFGRVRFDDGGELAVLGFPDEPWASVELVHRRGEPVVTGGLDHLAVQVDALEPAGDRLIDVGLEPGPIERPGGESGPRIAWLTDPDGHRIELVEWPAGHETGLTRDDFQENR